MAHGLSTRITFNAWIGRDGRLTEAALLQHLGGIHRKPADGSGQEELLMKDDPTIG